MHGIQVTKINKAGKSVHNFVRTLTKLKWVQKMSQN